jgi:hypothetical protein
MVLTTGDITGLGADIKRVATYMQSLGAIASQQASYSFPEYHPQATPIYGPQSDGGSPDLSSDVDVQIGQPTYAVTDQFTDPDDPNHPYMPYKGALHPHTIADYGVQGNFGRDADSTGVKGFIRVIPCRVLAWEICFLPPPGSTTVPTQSITIKIYDNYPTSGANLIDTVTVTNKQCDLGNLAIGAHNNFAQGGKIGIEVTAIGGTSIGTGAPTPGSGFIVGIGAKKLYPDLKVTS